MTTKLNITHPAVKAGVRTTRWIARDTDGREVVVYQATDTGARAMVDDSKILSTGYTLRRGGHIDTNGRLHIDDNGPIEVVDRRITS